MKERFARFASENNEAARSIDEDITAYDEPTGDIVVYADKVYDLEAFLKQHERKTVVIIEDHFEACNGDPEEWNYDIYYAGVNCFSVEVTDEELLLSDDELRELIEEKTDNQMGYGGTDYDIVVFEGERRGTGFSEYPIATVDNILRVIKRRV